MEEFHWWFKENWDSFKNVARRKLKSDRFWGDIYYLYHIDDGQSSYAFFNQNELDEWLDKEFWDGYHYEASDLETSMDDFKIWKLVPESDVKKYPSLYKDAKWTSLVVGEETYFRTPVSICVEQTVIVSTSSY
ncbi:hypothetical protein Thu_219 [Bacillus phage Thurquoise]|nr:hypothetical protein Thu_219 [Bacillus phage Thurquoise]